ncbi:hypothetical protein N836_07910 [Leptolyngbya sp. Heron Island J]|nr:hypothetical protein N836_07910 [Leptolyngbya sp. Heron Island J]
MTGIALGAQFYYGDLEKSEIQISTLMFLLTLHLPVMQDAEGNVVLLIDCIYGMHKFIFVKTTSLET